MTAREARKVSYNYPPVKEAIDQVQKKIKEAAGQGQFSLEYECDDAIMHTLIWVLSHDDFRVYGQSKDTGNKTILMISW